MPTMYCSNCGKPAHHSDRFCSHCGQPLLGHHASPDRLPNTDTWFAGWMIPFALALFFAPVVDVAALVYIFDQGSPFAAEASISRFVTGLAILIALALNIAALTAMIGRRQSFKSLAASIYAVSIVVSLVQYIAFLSGGPDADYYGATDMATAAATLATSVLSSLLVMLYFLQSKRVRQTFIN